MKAIIVPPKNGEEDGVYGLVAEDGEGLCSHLCSNRRYAELDLFLNRPERQALWERKGITQFVWLEDADISRVEIVRRNKEFYKEAKK